VSTRLITLRGTPTDAAVNLRLARWRALRQIERDLAGCDPRLAALFFSFTRLAGGKKMPRTERIRARPFRLAAWLRWRELPAADDSHGPAAWWR